MKCSRCGTTLKYPIKYNGKIYGRECISKILNEYVNTLYIPLIDGIYDMDAKKQQAEEQQIKDFLKSNITKIRQTNLIEVLKQRNNKNGFIESLIDQFNKKGYLSEKQEQSIKLNKQEKALNIILNIESGLYDMLDELQNTKGKKYNAIKGYEKEINKIDLSMYPYAKEVYNEYITKGYEQIRKEYMMIY